MVYAKFRLRHAIVLRVRGGTRTMARRLNTILRVFSAALFSAVMAATGLLYLAILTAFGTDLVARAVLAS